MPNKDDLKGLEVYCRNEKCGDPVKGRDGVVHYTKRRMSFMGFTALWKSAIG